MCAKHPPDPASIRTQVIDWYHAHGRELPWRHPDASPWSVLVSEVMLQQTPVARVAPVWEAWMRRWPTPADLASEPAGEVLRAWDRLGYPRRALRLHTCAQALVNDHDGHVPASVPELLALPGIGEYTAAAVASFAFGIPATVVDTNIRRVIGRAFGGRALPGQHMTRGQYREAEALMPAHPDETGTATSPAYSADDAIAANTWNAASMELGALICTAQKPACGSCPIVSSCAWVAAGKPAATYKPRGQAWQGTDRQVRGRIMAVLRAADHSVPAADLSTQAATSSAASTYESDLRASLTALADLPADDSQRLRCLEGLIADGLAVATQAGGVTLPG